jgi:RNA polymerase sigma-70 factor (ECF subfamily)
VERLDPDLADDRLVARLRARDEEAFRLVVERYHALMVSVARLYTPSTAVAEEVAQESWLGVLQGIDRFEGRSSFKTWLFHIVANRAKTRGVREHRTIPTPFPRSAADPSGDQDPVAFHREGPLRGMWAVPPESWARAPEDALLAAETLEVVRETIASLPEQQREVVTLRDQEGWSSADVCDLLDITEVNQRVLLHRARTRIREAVAAHLRAGERA